MIKCGIIVAGAVVSGPCSTLARRRICQDLHRAARICPVER
jgi:hypothetical protein